MHFGNINKQEAHGAHRSPEKPVHLSEVMINLYIIDLAQ